MKFDCIVGNPPYDRTLHIDLLETSLKILKGKLTFIEPSTWLINVSKNGNGKRYCKIKNRLEGHVESVVIENLNKEFGTCLFVPFSVTTVDFSKTFESIDFTCCGFHKTVDSIYDCNLVGDYKTIHSIINKVKKYVDFMENHITKEDMGDGVCYAKYAELTPDCGCGNTSERKGLKYDSKILWSETKNGTQNSSYITSAFHTYGNEISNKPLCSYDRGKHLTDKIADNVYGTREELENWKYFIYNNKLPLFLNIVLTIDQHNNSKPYLPWLVDRQYTDEEIKFGDKILKESSQLAGLVGLPLKGQAMERLIASWSKKRRNSDVYSIPFDKFVVATKGVKFNPATTNMEDFENYYLALIGYMQSDKFKKEYEKTRKHKAKSEKAA